MRGLMLTEMEYLVRVALKTLFVIAVSAGAFLFAARNGYVGFPAFGRAAAPSAAAPADLPPTPVLTVAVEVSPALDQVQAVGSLLADESVTISPEITGRIQELRFSEGQYIEKGTILAVLDSAEWEAVEKQSEAAVTLQELKFTRAAELRDKKTISQQEYDEINAALIVARAVLALARARLAKTVLRAPFSGILGLRQISPGDYVEAGQAIVNLEALNPLKADFRVPERYVRLLAGARGQRIMFRVDAYPEELFEGEVYAIDSHLDVASRSILLRARVANPSARLLPGMYAKVTVTLAERQNALWVPEQTLLPQGNQQFVYRVLDGRAVLTPVEIGIRKPGKVEIIEGLKPDDIVIKEGQLKLFDGAAVIVTDLPATKNTKSQT